MCDTFAANKEATASGKLIFGKNSDRSPNEPHLMLFEGAKKHNLDRTPTLKATYVEIPQVEKTYAALLLCPSWTWGCEMGMNELGVCIGNEAVFTKGKYGEQSLIGMDYCRLVLERCASAREGVDLIAELLGVYGQGGNCGFDHEFHYDNSYLIADRDEAWIIETVGKQWVAKRARDVDAISNELTITDDYELCSDELKGSGVNFQKKHINNLYAGFSGATSRRFSVFETLLTAKDGRPPYSILGFTIGKSNKNAPPEGISTDVAMRTLRQHSESEKGVDGVCMHYGGAVGDHTTGSLVAVPEDMLVFVTGCSTPCRAVFKPFSMRGKLPVFSEGQKKEAELYWYKREFIQRSLVAKIIDFDEYESERLSVQRVLIDYSTGFAGAGKAAATKLNEDVFALENDFVERWFARCSTDQNDLNCKFGKLPQRKRWNKKNAALCENYGKLISQLSAD